VPAHGLPYGTQYGVHLPGHRRRLPTQTSQDLGPFQPGDRIWANYKGQGKWYPAKLNKVRVSDGCQRCRGAGVRPDPEGVKAVIHNAHIPGLPEPIASLIAELANDLGCDACGGYGYFYSVTYDDSRNQQFRTKNKHVRRRFCHHCGQDHGSDYSKNLNLLTKPCEACRFGLHRLCGGTEALPKRSSDTDKYCATCECTGEVIVTEYDTSKKCPEVVKGRKLGVEVIRDHYHGKLNGWYHRREASQWPPRRWSRERQKEAGYDVPRMFLQRAHAWYENDDGSLYIYWEPRENLWFLNGVTGSEIRCYYKAHGDPSLPPYEGWKHGDRYKYNGAYSLVMNARKNRDVTLRVESRNPCRFQTPVKKRYSSDSWADDDF